MLFLSNLHVQAARWTCTAVLLLQLGHGRCLSLCLSGYSPVCLPACSPSGVDWTGLDGKKAREALIAIAGLPKSNILGIDYQRKRTMLLTAQ